MQREQFDISRADNLPFLSAGREALGGERNLMGLGGADAQTAAIEALRGGPMYESLYRNGEEAILQNGSATGGLRGGNMQRGLADFGSDTLMQVIQSQLAGLGGIANRGAGTGQYLGGLGSNFAAQGTQTNTARGDARARGALARGAITSGQFNSIGSFADSIAGIFAGGKAGGGLKGLFGT